MFLYNNYKGLFLIFILFIFGLYLLGISCPCDDKIRKHCRRLEIYGALYSHIVFFIVLGFLFPDYFIFLMISGVIFEIFEYLVDIKLSDYVTKNNFGCLSLSPGKIIQKPYYNEIYRKENIQNNSDLHMWKGNLPDAIANVIGFGIGYYLNKMIL